jgi:uncharacterized DUF497 family protein
MRIEIVVWLLQFEEKIQAKHGLTQAEIEEVLLQQPLIRFLERGHVPGEDLFAAYGQTISGRYIAVFFVFKPTRTALVISARDMDAKERRRYGKRK